MKFRIQCQPWIVGDRVIEVGSVVDLGISGHVRRHFSQGTFQPSQLCEPVTIAPSIPPTAQPLDEEARLWLSEHYPTDTNGNPRVYAIPAEPKAEDPVASLVRRLGGAGA